MLIIPLHWRGIGATHHGFGHNESDLERNDLCGYGAFTLLGGVRGRDIKMNTLITAILPAINCL